MPLDEQTTQEQPVQTQGTASSTASTQTEQADPQAPAWVRDLAAVDNEDWYKSVPEAHRQSVRAGLEARLREYDRGYQGKFQSLASERKAFEAERTKLQRESKLFNDLFAGNEDPRVGETQKRISELESQLAALTAERDGYKQKYDAVERAEIEREADRVIEQYRDIIDFKVKGKDGKESLPAWQKFSALMETGQFTEEEAAQVVRGMFKLSGTRALPDSLELASDGSRRGAERDDITDSNVPMHVAVARAAERNARRLGITD